MKHLIVGDIHGFHHNLRKFLVAQRVVNKKGERINQDTIKVYQAGDLIDGDVNRQGDILNLEYAPEWFDAVCIGNHEYAFLGGKEFGGRRKHDRKTMRMLLSLIDQGVYVPSVVADGHLITHAGLAKHFGFLNVEDAQEYIKLMWRMAPDTKDETPVFDWTGKDDVTYGDPTSGVFCLEWTGERNSHFPQVVGHTTYYTGPVQKIYEDGVTHWNVDVGAKTGKGVGGIILDDEDHSVKVVHWGNRDLDSLKTKKLYPPQGEIVAVELPDDKTKIPVLGLNGAADFLAPSKMKNSTHFGTARPLSIPLVGAEIQWHQLPLTNLADVQISMMDDPDIMRIYREELARGEGDMTLKDIIASDRVIH